MPTTAANDNAPTRADDFPDLAARRAWLASLKMPDNDSDIDTVLAWPTLARLHKAGDTAGAIALATWTDAMRPVAMPSSFSAANDNRPTEDGWERAVWAESNSRDKLRVGDDRILDIEPSANVMFRSAGDDLPGLAATALRNARIPKKGLRYAAVWSRLLRLRGVGPAFDQTMARLGGLTFLRGKLHRYTSHEKERAPRDSLRGAKGGGQAGRSAASIWRHLKRTPHLTLAGILTHHSYGGEIGNQIVTDGRTYERTPSAIAASLDLVLHGVDGSVSRERLPVPVFVGPTAIAVGSYWLGGVVRSTGQSTSGANAAAIEDEMARAIFATALRQRTQQAALLDLATTRMTAGEIGAAFGYSGKYAERWAIREIDRALQQLAA